MAATTVLTLAEWNLLIDRVNTAMAGCGGSSIPHVTALHLWSKTDITTLQNALKAGCSTNTFTTPVGPPYLWKQKIIDEINAAVAVGCCNSPTIPPAVCAQNGTRFQIFTQQGTNLPGWGGDAYGITCTCPDLYAPKGTMVDLGAIATQVGVVDTSGKAIRRLDVIAVSNFDGSESQQASYTMASNGTAPFSLWLSTIAATKGAATSCDPANSTYQAVLALPNSVGNAGAVYYVRIRVLNC